MLLLFDCFCDNFELVICCVIEGVCFVYELGVEVFGLGVFWSVVGNKGVDV